MNEINKEPGDEERKAYPFANRMSWFFLAGSILVLIYTY
jgi:hypothetical protein